MLSDGSAGAAAVATGLRRGSDGAEVDKPWFIMESAAGFTHGGRRGLRVAVRRGCATKQ